MQFHAHLYFLLIAQPVGEGSLAVAATADCSQLEHLSAPQPAFQVHLLNRKVSEKLLDAQIMMYIM